MISMERSRDTETDLFSPIEDKNAVGQPMTLNISPENDGRTILMHVLEFKTSLLEAIEELHIHRDAQKRYEEQICKLVLEKQELEWQKESLQNEISRISNENSESLAAVKKPLQAQIRRLEGEKGKIQLTSELKDKEITSLKEELKLLQLVRYSLEKKLAELEQKLQLQTQLKDSHLNQLGEVERRFGTVSRQCTAVKQAHEKLEQNVEEAMRINKNLTSINRKQESAIKALNKDVERLNKELVTFKVSSVRKPGEEHLQNVLKEQQLQQVQQRLFVEAELNKKLRNETAAERAEKQEILRSLHHTQRLLQTQTETLSRVEQELNTLHKEYQVLKTEHELNQEKAREEQDGFARLRDEYQNAKLAWEKKLVLLQKTSEADQDELRALKEAYNHLQEKNQRLSASVDHKTEDIQNSQITVLKDQESKTPDNVVSEINLVKLDGLHEDESFEESLIIPHDDGEPTRHPLKGVPDESTDSQKNTEDGCSHDDSIHVDEAITAVSSSAAPDALVLCVSDKISELEQANAVTNHLSNLCAQTETIVCESETVCNTLDKGCPPNQARSDADSCLTELSGPETSSVYEVDDDPLALEQKNGTLEQNLCMPEVTEPQTSDKHTDSQRCATEIKDQIAAPEFLCSLSQTEDEASTERLLEDKTYDIIHMTEDVIADQPLRDAFPCVSTSLDTHHHESKDHFSPPELISAHSQSFVSQTVDSTETNLSKQLPLIDYISSDQTVLATTANSVEAISENIGQQDDDCTFASCTQTLKAQQSEAVSPNPTITNPSQDHSSPVRSPKANDQSAVVGASYHAGYKRYRPSFAWDTFVKAKMNTQTKCADSNVDFLVGTRNSKPSLCLTPSTCPKSDQRSSGFLDLEFVSPFCTPRFIKDKLTKKAVMKTPDRSDAPNKRPQQKSDFRGEWDAIKQSFSEMLAEKENRVLISYSSTVSGSLASSSVGNGLRHDGTPTVSPPKLQSLEMEIETVAEGGTANFEGKEETNQSDMVAQIAKIEELVSLGGLTPQKIRKID